MKPPAEINAEVVLPSGDHVRWDSASPRAGNRPLDPQIETASGKGFGAGSVILQRPTDREYPELGLLNELILRTATGKIVYQGRAQGIPVSDTWQFDCEGWWSHGEQRTMTELLVDRDLSAWGESSLGRRVKWVGTGRKTNGTQNVGTDQKTGLPGVTLQIPISSPTTIIESMYDAGSLSIGSIYYDMISKSLIGDFAWIFATDDDVDTNSEATADMITGTDSTSSGTFAPTSAKRFAWLTLQSESTARTTEKSATFRKLAVYGNHGLTLLDREEGPGGIAASDAIKYLANKYAPKWDTSGVEETSYPIPHAVWKEPITATEAMKQLNSYHLWRLAVWEERKLTFGPYDLSVADWQVASGQDGVRVEYQGDTTENVFNGCQVSYTDFSGVSQRVTPDDADDLKDASEWIAANQWGDQAWLDIQVSWPCTEDDAVQIGAIALASANQARRPSTITVPMHIRDIHGSWWPSSYVRADQTITVTNQHSATPRLITSTRWSNHGLQITTDNAVDSLSVFNQRIVGALGAAGLT